MVRYNKKILAIGIAIIGLFILGIIGFTYAFFSASVEGNDFANPTVVETADLRLLFNDTQLITMEDVLPGASQTKTFTVTNIGNSKVYYDINIVDVLNTFVNEELIYSLTSTNGGGIATNEALPNIGGELLEVIEIEPGVTQTYTMTIKFKEIGSNQNENQGAEFSGKLQINASKLISDEVIFEIEETTGNVAITKSKSVNLVGLYYGKVSCESEDESIAECTPSNDKINVEGKLPGETEIIVTESAKNLSLIYNVRVLDVVLGLEETSGNVEKSITKSINIIGSDYGTLTCETSDESKATCSIEGTTLNITGIELGTATITLSESTANKTATYEATITYPTVYNKILADNNEQSDASINFALISSNTNGKGLYYTANTQYGEEGQRIYYYRGDIENNWVSFGGFLWRIVRTTSEGGVKLAYSGNGTTNSSAFTHTAVMYYNSYGHLTGYTNGDVTQTDTTIKAVVDIWYNNNLNKNGYPNYISNTAIHCNDRGRISSEATNYNFVCYPYYRFLYAKKPTYACPSANASRYTVSMETGNGYLSKPIALLTSDDIYFAGLRTENVTSNSYIMDNATGYNWWTMSPKYSESNKVGQIMRVNLNGSFYSNDDTYTNIRRENAVRPAISLKSCIVVTAGDGTQGNPYVVLDSACQT